MNNLPKVVALAVPGWESKRQPLDQRRGKCYKVGAAEASISKLETSTFSVTV